MEKITMKKSALCSLSLALIFPSWALAAGSLVPPAAPTDNASAIHTTDDLYNRLHTGAVGSKRSGAFTEPSAGPAAGVGKSLDEIMAVAPAADNVNGANPDDVKSGKTYWSLRTDSTWGLQAGTAYPYPAPVPKSGQTTTYVSGDDGAKLKGVDLPTPRFTKHVNGTVTDNLTGLIWLTNANCVTVSPNTWTAALTAVANLKSGDCGLADGSVAGNWRMPNRRELFSLVNDQYSSPAVSNTAGSTKWSEGAPFSVVQSNYYWTSTTNTGSTSYAWCVHFANGTVIDRSKATAGIYVWPVRGGQ